MSVAAICTARRNLGDMSSTSSIAPRYIISNMQPKMTKSDEQSVTAHVHTNPSIMPKNMAIPPNTGTGTACNFRELGLSTMFFSFASLTSEGCMAAVAANDTQNGIRIRYSKLICLCGHLPCAPYIYMQR